MAPGRVARWFEMHLADELGVRPEVDRCVECDRVLEVDRSVPLGAAARRRRVRPVPGPAARAGRPLSLEALKLLKAYQRQDIEALAASGWPSTEREVEAAMRDFLRSPSSATPARWRSSTRSASATPDGRVTRPGRLEPARWTRPSAISGVADARRGRGA